MSWQKEWIEVRGHRVYLERFETDSPLLVVLLHHGLGSVQAWRAQMDFLTGQGIPILAYDRWGYGQSDDRARLDPPFFEEDVQDLEAIVSQFAKPLVLVGHSDGGNIALTYASRHPENLRGVVVIAAHIHFEPKMASGMQELIRSYRENEVFKKSLHRVHKGKPVFERWFQAWTQLGMDWDMRRILSSISCPVFVVQGSEDEHATIQQALDLTKALPNGRVQILERVNHMLPQKAAGIFNPLLSEALVEFQKGNQYVQ